MQDTPLARKKPAFLLLAANIFLYIACLFMPAYESLTGTNEPSIWPGAFALALGFIGHISWLANPLLFFAWFSFKRRRSFMAASSSFLGLLVALTFLQGGTLPVGSMGIYPYKILSGYYIWMLAIISTVLASLVQKYQSTLQANE
jgi:hypothetical protein